MGVAPVFVLSRDKILLLDNSANQRHPHVIATMELLLHGNFKFNVEYSPELNPIERGFSLVRRWIRTNEKDLQTMQEG